VSRTSGDTPGAKPLVILGIVAALLLGGLIWYTQRGPSPTYDPQNPPDIKAERTERKYVATFYRDGQLVSEERTLTEGQDAVVESVNSALASIPAVAPEARLVETQREGDTLALRFTSNFTQTYGTDDESNVITAVMKAVSLNSDADMVVFEIVDGKPIETLGSIDLVGPQSVRDWIGG
jgi:hypothetical protein